MKQRRHFNRTFRSAATRILAAALLAVFAPLSSAGEIGLNVFGFSFHIDRSENFNEINPGLGLHYAFAKLAARWELFADSSIYYDSRRNEAKYAALGTHYRFGDSWKAGFALACAQSRSYNSGDPFFVVIPTLAFKYHRIVLNTVVLPSEEKGSKIAGLAFFVTIPLERGD